MSHKHHSWKNGESPPPIRAHSLAKHRVLRSYLERYVATLTKNPRQDTFRLTLVDGFSGGGIYLDERTSEEKLGSPLIMLEAMEAAARAAQLERTKPFHLDVQYVFIEKDAEAFDHLRRVIANSRFSPLLESQIQLIHGEFVPQARGVCDLVKNRGRSERAIFVLDQFGYTDVPLSSIKTILSLLKNAEVMLTFATDFLIDYLSEEQSMQEALAKLGLSLSPNEIKSAKERREWRRAIQLLLHRQIPERTGAKYYTPFFIRSLDSHRDFWLIHLSGHYRARDVMVGLHWSESNSFAHFGGSGLQMLGYDPNKDARLTKQHMLPGFYFDETARTSSHEELLGQLPERLANHRDGVTFSDFFSQLTNECPVTTEIMKEVLGELTQQGIVVVKDKDGNTIRRSGIQSDSDVLTLSRQRRIFAK